MSHLAVYSRVRRMNIRGERWNLAFRPGEHGPGPAF